MVQTAHSITRPPDRSATEYPTCASSSLILCNKSPTPVMILVTARQIAHATCTSRDKQTRFSKRNKNKGKKPKFSEFQFKPR
jgi:hypothetical protein